MRAKKKKEKKKRKEKRPLVERPRTEVKRGWHERVTESLIRGKHLEVKPRGNGRIYLFAKLAVRKVANSPGTIRRSTTAFFVCDTVANNEIAVIDTSRII